VAKCALDNRRVRLGMVGLIVMTSFAATPTSTAETSAYRVVEKSLIELESDLEAGRVTSEQLVEAYLSRINALDRHGPRLHSVISLNPDAKLQARRLDIERKQGKVRSKLHGIPIMLKDNIESADNMPTTAGTTALRNNLTGVDSGLAARLRAAGAIILAKTNLSNWADMQSQRLVGGRGTGEESICP
jgi:amidase